MKRLFSAVTFLSLAFPLNSAFSFDEFQLCMHQIHGEHDQALALAQAKYLTGLQDCLNEGREDLVSSCQEKARETFQQEKDGQRSILNLKRRGCMKMPWAY